jgi:hypothetical protein
VGAELKRNTAARGADSKAFPPATNADGAIRFAIAPYKVVATTLRLTAGKSRR